MNFEEEIYEEVTLEKDRSAEDKRRTDWKKAIARFNLVQSVKGYIKQGHGIGYFRNNNEVNSNIGLSKKTNTRKSSASYRHKGGYGRADKYSVHDQRQLDDMKEELRGEIYD